MIRQEKRKRRWLEKNGFTFVTDDNRKRLEEHLRDVGEPTYYAGHLHSYRVIHVEGFMHLYPIGYSKLEEDLFEIKLGYVKWKRDMYKGTSFPRLRHSLRRFKRQCSALIKHGINPWW